MEFHDFPYLGDHNPNWRTPSFFIGVGLNHQPEMLQKKMWYPHGYFSSHPIFSPDRNGEIPVVSVAYYLFQDHPVHYKPHPNSTCTTVGCLSWKEPWHVKGCHHVDGWRIRKLNGNFRTLKWSYCTRYCTNDYKWAYHSMNGVITCYNWLINDVWLTFNCLITSSNWLISGWNPINHWIKHLSTAGFRNHPQYGTFFHTIALDPSQLLDRATSWGLPKRPSGTVASLAQWHSGTKSSHATQSLRLGKNRQQSCEISG